MSISSDSSKLVDFFRRVTWCLRSASHRNRPITELPLTTSAAQAHSWPRPPAENIKTDDEVTAVARVRMLEIWWWAESATLSHEWYVMSVAELSRNVSAAEFHTHNITYIIYKEGHERHVCPNFLKGYCDPHFYRSAWLVVDTQVKACSRETYSPSRASKTYGNDAFQIIHIHTTVINSGRTHTTQHRTHCGLWLRLQSWLMLQSPHCLWNDLKCVQWDVKPCSIQSNPISPNSVNNFLNHPHKMLTAKMR